MKLFIDLTEEELRKAEEVFNQLGTTTVSAVKQFIQTTIQDSVPQKVKRDSKRIQLKADENHMLRLPEDAPKETMEWLEND